MRRTAVLMLVFAVLAAGGWWFWHARPGADASGTVTLEWRGSDRGRGNFPGRIAWCPVTRMATLTAISGDTGLLVTLLEADSLSVGPHQVVTPSNREASPRPNATAALRWVNDTIAIIGYASVSGVVELSSVGPAASGSMEIRLRMPLAMDTIVLRGDFRDLPVVASAVGCP